MKLIHFATCLTLIASACGGSAAPTDEDAVSETSTTTESTTAAPSTTTTPTTEPPTTVASISNPVEYCAFILQLEQLTDDWNPFDPEDTERYIEEIEQLLSQVDAPEEIRGDFDVVAGALIAFGDELEANDWDAIAVSDFDMSEADEAGERLDVYDREVCGFDGSESAGESESEDDPTVDPNAELLAALLQTESGREAFADELVAGSEGELTNEQATCFVDNMDGEFLVALTALGSGADDDVDPQTMLSFFEILDTCEVPLSAIAG